MTQFQEFSVSAIRPEAMMESAQRRLAGWSRAWTQVAQGFMTAGMAQMEVARALWSVTPGDFGPDSFGRTPHDAARRYFDGAKARYDIAVERCRHANDELVSCLFAAADSLVEALPSEALPANLGLGLGLGLGAEPAPEREQPEGLSARKERAARQPV